MVATFKQSYQPSIQLVSRARHDVTNFATFCGFNCRDISDIALAVGEAVSNVVEHAKSARDFDIRCEFDAETLLVNVEDHGSGFTLTHTLTPQSRGRGIYLMKQVMDRAEYLSKPGNGTVLTLEKRKPRQ